MTRLAPEECAILRRAHADHSRYQRMNRPAPALIATLERDYQKWRKQAQRKTRWQHVKAAAA